MDIVGTLNLAIAIALSTFAVLVGVPTSVQAGPPLVCHPLLIGNAKFFPSGDGPFGFDKEYNRDQLVEETLALLSPNMPVIVRVETLRRATLYATRNLSGARHIDRSSRYTGEDRRLAFHLLSRLMARALISETHGKPDGLAWFDVGYLMERFEQTNLMEDVPGYELVMKAMRLRGEDPDMELACASITKWPLRDEHREHLRKATAEAKNGSLPAANFALHVSRSRGSR